MCENYGLKRALNFEPIILSIVFNVELCITGLGILNRFYYSNDRRRLQTKAGSSLKQSNSMGACNTFYGTEQKFIKFS